MSALFLGRDESTALFQEQSWQRTLFNEMEAALTSDSRPFPCIFGVAGFRANHLRFCFLDKITPESLGPVMEEYLPQARNHGRNASLVVFERPSPVTSLDAYRDRFWGLLDGLSQQDPKPWPEDVPHQVDDAKWEFCYAGEPIFVVCNTPAHVERQSRRSSSFMLTMQPRWVFEGITDNKQSADSAFRTVRQRLQMFDMLPPSPALGRYGDKGVYEFAQYFIGEDNQRPSCPMSHLSGATKSINVNKLETAK